MNARHLKICKAVAVVFRITNAELLSRSRAYAFPRQIAMTLCWERNDNWAKSKVDLIIAEEFGFDRTNVFYARREIESQRKAGAPGRLRMIMACEDAVRGL